MILSIFGRGSARSGLDLNNESVRNRYNFIKIPGLLEKLNKIVDWEKTDFPAKLKDGIDINSKEATDPKNLIQDRELLGNPPTLIPGDAFKWDSTLFQVNDEDSVIPVTSETGYGGMGRFEDMLNLEYEVKFETTPAKNIEITDYTGEEFLDPDGIDSPIQLPKLLREAYKIDPEKDVVLIKVKTEIEDLGEFDIDIAATKSRFFYDKEACSESLAIAALKKILKTCM